MYYIYCYTNKITNRKYVGQTNNIERRKREHRSCALNEKSSSHNDLFHTKLRQYGEENFEFNIVEEIPNDNIDFVNKREKYWISNLQTNVKDFGYNLTMGGLGNQKTNRVLTLEEVNMLKDEIKKGQRYSFLMEKYQISTSYISSINHGTYYYNPQEQYPLFQYYKTDNDYQILIDLLLNSELSFKQISEELKIGESTVKKINYGKLRKGLYHTYPIRTSHQQRKANKIKELLILGKSNREILLEVDVSLATINRINNGETNFDEKLVYPLR